MLFQGISAMIAGPTIQPSELNHPMSANPP
jgi:hypothetical protein